MRLANGVYKSIKVDWDNVTLPLKEGTPVSECGVEVNNGDAIGLIPRTYEMREPEKIFVICGGDMDLEDVETVYGYTLTDEVKSALRGIRFHKADGSIDNVEEEEITDPWMDGGQWYKATYVYTFSEGGSTGELIEDETDDFIIEHYIDSNSQAFELTWDGYDIIDYKIYFEGDCYGYGSPKLTLDKSRTRYVLIPSPAANKPDIPVTYYMMFYVIEPA